MGEHHMRGGSEYHVKAWFFRLEQWSNITLSLRRTYRDYINSVLKSCQVHSLDMRCTRWESGKETYWSRRHWETGKDGRIWNPHKKTQCKGSANAHEWWQLKIPNRGWNSQSLWRRSASENIHLNPGSSWQRLEILCTVITWNRESKLFMPGEESFPIPLKSIDATRNTYTSLDVMSEKSIDDYWNVDGDRELSDTWTGFHKIHYIECKATGWIYMVPGGHWRENKRPQSPTNYGQKYGNKCLMHQNVKTNQSVLSRNQSSIMPEKHVVFNFIDPEDEEFKEIMMNARGKLEIPMPAAMPCKSSLCRSSRETCRAIGGHKTKYACIVEADESMGIRLEGAPRRYHEDHIAGKGTNSLSHYNLVHKFIPSPQAMKILDAKAAVEKWENSRKSRHGSWRKSETKMRWSRKQGMSAEKVHFASLMDLCHLKNSELEPQFQKYKGRVALRGDIVKDDSGSYAVFIEQGSSASQITDAKSNGYKIKTTGMRRTSSRRSIRLHPSQNRRCTVVTEKFQSEWPDMWIRPPKHKWPKSWSSMEDPGLPLKRNLNGHPSGLTVVGKAIRECSI